MSTQAITGGKAVFGSKRDPAQPVSLSSLFFRPCDKLMNDLDNPLSHWMVNMPTGEDITVPSHVVTLTPTVHQTINISIIR
jgi:hypothetical protein